jgi:uncharacterized membrane protein
MRGRMAGNPGVKQHRLVNLQFSIGGLIMTTATHLWAVGYNDVRRAAEVRDKVIRLGAKHCLVLMDTAVFVRYADGIATLDGEPFFAATDYRERGFAGWLARIALSAPLLNSAAVGAVVSSPRPVAADVGINDDFIREIERLMKPGMSAIFVLDQVGDMDDVLREIRGIGGTVLKTTVDLQRAKLIQSTLAASPKDGD